MAWTETQQKVVAIVPKFSASASIIGSSCIIYEVLVFDRRKLSRVYHRLLLVMSIYDVMESSLNFCSSWPIPRGTEGIAFASGNQGTCTFQGFILQFGLAIPILNMCLSIYYLLVIKYSWTEERIRKSVEKWFYIAATSIALGFCFASLGMELYNNANLWCWIAPLPLDCLDTFRYGSEGNCIRGNNAWIYRWAFYYAELWFCILFVMFAMLAVYFEVRRLELASQRYDPSLSRTTTTMGEDDDLCAPRLKRVLRRIGTRSGSNVEDTPQAPPKTSKSRRVAIQALWYVGAFYLTFLFATINRLIQQIANQTYFAMTVLHTIFEPSQGFLNYCVYLRPRYVNYREQHPSISRFGAVRNVIFPSEEDSKARKASRYVDEDHEDEEAARKELSRWRKLLMLSTPRQSAKSSETRSSGIFRFVSDEINDPDAEQAGLDHVTEDDDPSNEPLGKGDDVLSNQPAQGVEPLEEAVTAEEKSEILDDTERTTGTHDEKSTSDVTSSVVGGRRSVSFQLDLPDSSGGS